MDTSSELPTSVDVGDKGAWRLPSPGGTGPVSVTGTFIGMASSRRDSHNRHTMHNEAGYCAPRERCSACRWSVFRVFRDEAGYLIHHTGMSAVPGETMRFRNERVKTAYEVVESMTTRRSRTAYLTVAAAMVLAQCAAYDVPLRDAWENRAVG